MARLSEQIKNQKNQPKPKGQPKPVAAIPEDQVPESARVVADSMRAWNAKED